MNKKQLDKELSEIEVPNEVFDAIDKGIARGRMEKKKINSKKIIGTISSVAAVSFLASGLIFAPMTNVLASVPLIGSIYEKFSLQIGHELLESNLITQLNQEATSNGVDITLTSAYYDGNVIGITFKAKGERVSLDSDGDKETESGYNFHLFDGVEQNQWSSAMTQLEETEDGYEAAIEFYNPNANLPKDYTLPFTLTSITGIKGNWKFDIPLEQIPLETINSDAESIFNGQDNSLKMESVVKGKATTLLNYKTTFPLVGEDDDIRITVFDNEGNRLSKNHADVLVTEQDGGLAIKEVRELFSSKINEEAKFLIVQPEIIRNEEDTFKSLNQKTPFMVESNRFDYKIRINSLKQNGNQLILDYNVQNVNTDAIRKDSIQNFANFIMLIKSEDIQRRKMLEYEIRSNQAEVMADGSLHYQSIFNIENLDKFDYRDYSLTVPFGILSANEPIKMNQIIVDLNK
ncbi:DUF4179 domain-containing protein [Paenisporosarcina antarctica]|uniref:DUF4179 domain-containing protein n=1 Tax=Paenisporosarcina antarctica TaxID=417367 RepID=A0A4P6ZXL2_9BACL|nr:DUF4179 domain-containing protein [Paenisporosarcina antarctica]QBP41013.1 DUF4179 domain-containing protein [Paenisporosarcina antarctica]